MCEQQIPLGNEGVVYLCGGRCTRHMLASVTGSGRHLAGTARLFPSRTSDSWHSEGGGGN